MVYDWSYLSVKGSYMTVKQDICLEKVCDKPKECPGAVLNLTYRTLTKYG